MRSQDCKQCGYPLDILRRPLRRLRWTRYWWRGLASFVTQPLLVCTRCGTIYTYAGGFVAAGAAETDAEVRLGGFRDDMRALRDGFATLVLVGEVGAVWTLWSAPTYGLGVTVALGAIGAVSVLPFTYFGRKVVNAKRDLKRLKGARVRGELSE